MIARVLTGSKTQIAEQLTKLEGDVREAIVFVEEPSKQSAPLPPTVEALFAEMEPHLAQVSDFDDSRQAIYDRLEDE